MRDLVVLLPGITGSVLARAGHTAGAKPVDVWAPSGQALYQALKTMGGSITNLAVPAHDPRKPPPDTGITATGVVQDFHGVLGLGKIDGYTTLATLITDHFLVTRGSLTSDAPANFFEFPYDWRLSNRHSATELRQFIKIRLANWREASNGAPDGKVVLIAHSMGGLVSRYYLEVLEGWRDCRALITFGTPYRGAVNAVGFIANGYKQIGLDLTAVLRSCPAVYELFPVYKALKTQEWRRVSEVSVPNAVADYVAAAAEFHQEIRTAVDAHEKEADYLKSRYRIFPFVGVSQPTLQSARLANGVLETSLDRPEVVDEPLDGGDGTVPRVSATPLELSDEARETFFGERHASLQKNEYALDDVRERLKQLQSKGLDEIRGVWRAGQRPVIGLGLEDLYLPGEPVVLRATVTNGEAPKGLIAQFTAASGGASTDVPFKEDADAYALTLEGLLPGMYRVRVRSAIGGETAPTPVRDVFEIAAT